LDSVVQTNFLPDGVTVVTLNRPEARNAVNAALAGAIECAVDGIENDTITRVAIITGAGDSAFCSGADLKEVATGGLSGTFTERGGFAGFVNADRRKVWIAAVNGAALAGGFEIVLACDLVIATEQARFGLPEVTRGLIASAGGLYRLPRALPKAIALEMILTGQPIVASRALELGLINKVVPQGQALSEAVVLANLVCRNAPLAVRESLAIARAAAGFESEELRSCGNAAQSKLETTADYREGALAFVEKRPPQWQGK